MAQIRTIKIVGGVLNQHSPTADDVTYLSATLDKGVLKVQGADPAAVASAGVLYSKVVTDVGVELFYRDDAGVVYQLTPAAGMSIGGTVTSGVAGSVLFVGAGVLAQDNTNLFWDDTNNRLGLGVTAPTTRLDLDGTITVRTGDVLPFADASGNVGTAAKRWSLVRAVTVTQGDLELESEDGTAKWTIREDVGRILAIDRVTGKRYKLLMEEVP